jgi:hypothetical protein
MKICANRATDSTKKSEPVGDWAKADFSPVQNKEIR